MSREVGLQVGQVGQQVGEVAPEQRGDVVRAAQRGEARRGAIVGQEQGDGEGSLGVGQGNAHVAAARPDVQGVRLDAEPAVGRRRDLKFLVAVAQRLEALAQRSHRRHRRAQRRTRAVGADQHRRLDHAGIAGATALQPRQTRFEVGAHQALVEVKARACGLRGVEQGRVEPAAVHRPDHLAVVTAVAQQVGRAVEVVDHAAAHHHRLRQNRALEPRDAQRVHAAFGQREVDRATALVPGHARVRAPLEHLHAQSAAGQQGGQQCSGQTGACDDDAIAHRERDQASTASTRRAQSDSRLYSGTGAARITSGSRQSTTTPSRSSQECSERPSSRLPRTRSDS